MSCEGRHALRYVRPTVKRWTGVIECSAVAPIAGLSGMAVPPRVSDSLMPMPEASCDT